MAHRMIPMLWFRIVILIGFLGYTAYSQMWLLAGIGVVLLVLTGFQLRTARSTRDSIRAAKDGSGGKEPGKSSRRR
ncbi:hypothetical protein OS123_00300 [Corynebacterium sp. P5875]|uniref:Uncharacterized protein n=1 Tax=Corynebacterium antarcticum TaxID=2800405 RepID=A0A9Q4CA24_9CORY|nr:hypothetical protein [Corynebacterium antarcticum]MCX7536991.1 hypothetical protein [Corynebacterium antarcticum]